MKKGSGRKRISGIYKIYNLIDDKIYIGSSQYIQSRWQAHRKLLKNQKHHSIHLQRWVNKYGIDNLIFEVVEKCDIDFLIIREQYYLDTLKPKFNIRVDAKSNKGLKQSKEHTAKMVEINSIPICQYTLDGKFIKLWKSTIEIERTLGYDRGGIYACKKGKIQVTANGYRWKEYKGSIEDIEPLKNGLANKRIIHLIDDFGNILDTYNSMTEAGKRLNICPKHISCVCKGLRNHTFGYKFKYAD